MPNRFVPSDASSLSCDAPGYGEIEGPVCWKCRGKVSNHNNNNNNNEKRCVICHGTGRLQPVRNIPTRVGKVTRGRQNRPHRDGPHDPKTKLLPVGYQVPYYGPLVQQATKERVDIVLDAVAVVVGETHQDDPPPQQHQQHQPNWWPRDNEELCNLVGEYRILQKYRSHRWTTDDLVTAVVAAKTLKTNHNRHPVVHYCDLGTGNGSVLQMVLWKCHDYIASAVGVEARQEALNLARRSLNFNIGMDDDDDDSSLLLQPKVALIHEDFRNFPPPILAKTFDLVTGTPPYFAVQSVDSTTTIIQQGAMPSAMQSAPARCEFRGGIEAYCAAAQRLLKDNGHFVCCENYMNHVRAMKAFAFYNFQVERIHYVRGKEGRERLFVVYVVANQPRVTAVSAVISESAAAPCDVVEQEVSVRDTAGAWTKDYQDAFLRYMDVIE